MNSKELFEKMKGISEEQTEEIYELLDAVFAEIETKFPSYYHKYNSKLEKILNIKPSLTEEEAKYYTSKLHNEDGTEGPHWSCDDIAGVIEEYEELERFPFWNVYYVMNMIYSDYYDSSFTLKTYVRLAYRFMCDKDAPHDKVLIYAKHMSH